MIGGRPLVAVHQPNYAPWCGYFAKIATADIFVFLDDAQYSKNNYINRVQVMGAAGPKWLTVPVSHRFGEPILAVRPAREDWVRAHLDTLRTLYRAAPAFAAVWPEVENIYQALPGGSLADINIDLVVALAERLELGAAFRRSSAIDSGERRSDDRLAHLTAILAPEGTYLSGRGGAKYQDPETFRRAGIGLRYSDFMHPIYDQGTAEFTPGLSVLDAVFRLGWSGAGGLLRSATAMAAA